MPLPFPRAVFSVTRALTELSDWIPSPGLFSTAFWRSDGSIPGGKYNRIRNVTAPNSNVTLICLSLVIGTVATLIIQDLSGATVDANSGFCTFQQNATTP